MAVNPIKVWNGTAWEYTGPVVAAPPVKYQATAPTSPATGDVWVESDYDVASVDPSKLLTGGVYTNESTRSAAIPTPTTGMVTYVGDTGTESPSSTIPQLEAYTGAAWQNLGGMTLLASTGNLSGTTIALDNVFTSQYENYVINITDINMGNNGAGLQFQFRNGSSTISTSSYINHILGLDTSANNFVGTFGYYYMNAFASDFGSANITIQNPVSTGNGRTAMHTAFGYNGNQIYRTGGMRFTSTTSANGFILSSSGANGINNARIRVYGMRNS
jgi:hypothetical protein